MINVGSSIVYYIWDQEGYALARQVYMQMYRKDPWRSSHKDLNMWKSSISCFQCHAPRDRFDVLDGPTGDILDPPSPKCV